MRNQQELALLKERLIEKEKYYTAIIDLKEKQISYYDKIIERLEDKIRLQELNQYGLALKQITQACKFTMINNHHTDSLIKSVCNN